MFLLLPNIQLVEFYHMFQIPLLLNQGLTLTLPYTCQNFLNLSLLRLLILISSTLLLVLFTDSMHCMWLKSFNSDYIKPFLHLLASENKQLIIYGDFNVNLLNVQEDLESTTFLDSLGSNLILPHILLPTRITEDSHTLIDNIFSSA